MGALELQREEGVPSSQELETSLEKATKCEHSSTIGLKNQKRWFNPAPDNATVICGSDEVTLRSQRSCEYELPARYGLLIQWPALLLRP